MYTFLINEDNTVTCSVEERVMQRSKQVDKLHFLADQTYKGIDMTDYLVNLEYVLPVSKRYISESLVRSDELYKNKLEYTLPFDTNLTSEAGDIEFQITFASVSMDPDGTTVQHVRKVGPGVIKIVSVANWSDMIPDAALSGLDQRLLKIDATLKALSDRNQQIFDSKADNLSYVDQKLQLTSNGKPIGNAVKITQESVETQDGSLRVVPF